MGRGRTCAKTQKQDVAWMFEELKEMGIPDHLICLLRNLYAGQEATIRTGHGTTHWFQRLEGGEGQEQGLLPATWRRPGGAGRGA